MRYLKTRNVKSPNRGTDKSAGIDFYVPEGHGYFLMAGQDVLIPSGIRAKVPEGYALIAFNKSGIATKKKLTIGACVIDEDYQGEIHIHLFNMTDYSVTLLPGDKIAQFILIPVSYEEPEEMFSEADVFPELSERGAGAFGSTNHK